jgi:hypothetical protein
LAVIFLFVDGVGLGKRSNENPFFTKYYESLQILSGENFFNDSIPIYNDTHLFKAIDANLEIDGLPQSGTGQASLFSGENASKIIGKHFGPYPHSGIKYLLEEHSLFHSINELGRTPYFINAYPPIFIDYSMKRNRWSCSTLMVRSAGLPLNSTQEIENEVALTAEIIQNAWREKLHISIPKITAIDAAQRLLHILPGYDLVMYEYYLTDKAGHNKSHEDAETVMDPFDEFLLHILKHKKEDDLLVITSDHGNMEDLSVKTHTRNKVPLMVYGKGAHHFHHVESIVDVKHAILSTFNL